MPRVEDLYAKLSGGQKFTKLDLKHAYLQIELEEDSKKYVTINTPKGLFRYNRLPFGVSSAPAIFQRIMDTILSGIPFVVSRMDDILISGENDEDHVRNLDEVLKRLAAAGLRLNRAKCVFMALEVIYLGYKIDAEGLHPVKEKVCAIALAPTPKNVKELRSYLGCLNYYAKFIPNLSSELQELHKLLEKNVRFQWGTEQDRAFTRSKDLLQAATVLVHYDPKKEIVLSCDASPYGIGAVLGHRFEDGSERPISFASRTLGPAERNYSQLEKEALAIVWGVKKFHAYLYGQNFTVYNDHKPLETLLSEKKPIPALASGRLQRWALTLSAYQYTLRYKPGELLANADAMSRLPLPDTSREVLLPAETVCLIEFMDTTPIDVDLIKHLTDRDPVLSRVRRFVDLGWPAKNGEEELQPYFTRREELSIQSGCILWGARVIVPTAARKRVVDMVHEAHPGIVRMKTFARSYVWWPKLDRDLENMVKECETCQVHRHAPPKASLHPWAYPTRPWSRLHADYAGPYKDKMLLIIVDAHTKWMDVHVMTSSKADFTVEKLRMTFATFGIPDTMVTDNGTNFVSEEFQTFMSRNGIKHIKVAPRHPASNGLAERAVQSVKEGLDKLKSGTMEAKVARFLFRYRNTPHSTTGKSPAEMMFGRRVKTHLDLMHPDNISDHVHEQQWKQKLQHDSHAKDRLFNVGDKVNVTNFSSGPCWLPGVISMKTGPVSFVVDLAEGRSVRRHQDHVRRRYESQTTVSQSEVHESVLPSGVNEDRPSVVPSSVPNPIVLDEERVHVPGTRSTSRVTEPSVNIELTSDNQSKSKDSPQVMDMPLRRSGRIRHAPDRLDL
jgi:hypothetical protein